MEAFRVVDYAEASTRSLEEFRRSIGPALIRDGRERGSADLRRHPDAQPAGARQGGAGEPPPPGGEARAGRARQRRRRFRRRAAGGVPRRLRAHAGGAAGARRPLARGQSGCLHGEPGARRVPGRRRPHLSRPLDRLLRAHRSGPEPVVYSDAVTVVYERREESWQPLHRTLQYSLDFDPDYLLLANYIPLHTLLLPRALFDGVGGFDEKLEYSEDWDFLIRLSFETAFRHVRAVTCEYRVFEGPEGDPFHVPAGRDAFQRARAEIYARYAGRRTEEGLARVFDRFRAQISPQRRPRRRSRRASCAINGRATGAWRRRLEEPSRSRRNSSRNSRPRGNGAKSSSGTSPRSSPNPPPSGPNAIASLPKTSSSTHAWRSSSRATRSTTARSPRSRRRSSGSTGPSRRSTGRGPGSSTFSPIV